jgi:hypothetical protein
VQRSLIHGDRAAAKNVSIHTSDHRIYFLKNIHQKFNIAALPIERFLARVVLVHITCCHNEASDG